MSDNQRNNELKYKLAFSFLKKLHLDGKITASEFKIAYEYASMKYQPKLITI